MKLQRSLHRSTSKERGSALAISLIVVMVIASLGGGLIQMHGAIARRQLQSVDNKRALYIAEAGLSEAFMAITHGKSGNIGSEQEPAFFGNGVFWVEALDQGDDTIALVSNALCETGRFSLSMVVKRAISPIASLGVFGADSVTIGKGTIIDGYDSQAGPYATQVDASLPHASTGEGARLTSNSNIQIDGSGGGGDGIRGVTLDGSDSTWVYGDARPGPLGTVVSDPDVLVTGSTLPTLKPYQVEALQPPGGLTGLTNLSHTGTRPMVLSDTANKLRKLHVGTGSELVLEGPVTLLAMGLILDSGAKLTIDTTNGPVMLYVTTYVNMASGSVLSNTTADPTQMALVIGGEGSLDFDGDGIDEPAVTIASEGEFHGLLYAPRADVQVPSALRMFGCMTAKSIEFAPDSHFSYDIAMNSTGVAVTGLAGLLSWRIVELPDIPLVRRRIDPIRWFELQGRTLKPSHESHMETHLHIEYTDLGGFTQVYDGLEASFDWTQVKTVDRMRWANDVPSLSTAPTSEANGGSMGALNLQQI